MGLQGFSQVCCSILCAYLNLRFFFYLPPKGRFLFCTTEHKYEIVKKLQEKKHICGMTGDGVNDAPALKKADIGIAVADATDAARGASDIVLTEPGLSVIISAVLTSRAIFQRMKNYTVSSVCFSVSFLFSRFSSIILTYLA